MSVPHDELLKIGDFARLADTNLRTLRYYEELGLLAPASRSRGGFRYYRRTDIHRVHMIRDLQDLGLQLERIRDLINARSAAGDRDEFLVRTRGALQEQLRLLEERARALAEQRDRVRAALDKLGSCVDCDRVPDEDNNFCEPCSKTGEPLPADLSALFSDAPAGDGSAAGPLRRAEPEG